MESRIFLFVCLVFCFTGCKKSDVEKAQKKAQTKKSSLPKKIHMVHSKKILVWDLSGDSIDDTLFVESKDAIYGPAFEMTIVYSYRGKTLTKKIHSGNYSKTFEWGFGYSPQNVISARSSTDRGYDDTYFLEFDRTKNLFYLKRHVGIYPSSIKRNYKLFENESIDVELFSRKICKSDYEENIVVYDTIPIVNSKKETCIDIPKTQSGINDKWILEEKFELPKLTSIVD